MTKPAAKTKPEIDWEGIEREYRAGQLSVVEIGRQFGVSHTAINKRAKKNGWTRDLTEKVRKEVSARLVSDEVSATNAREAVTLAAERGVQVVRSHRNDISQGRERVTELIDELKEATTHRAEIEAAIEEETAGDKNSERRNRMLRAVGLPARAGVIRELATALKALIPLERQAFNLDEKGEPPKLTPREITADMTPQDAADAYQASLHDGD
ncbi:hypothetical protein [Hyphomicrobium sp. CS1GBMeth3]|uniref:hypothetical protein n=1 Tax=Hyphomicrobium sp. CS1GBMeth3 TaxID=1892845 RepID=UPI000930C900|nr:hypothetical protein [Hyphomicrobium sp. CS1GBMeth3]